MDRKLIGGGFLVVVVFMGVNWYSGTPSHPEPATALTPATDAPVTPVAAETPPATAPQSGTAGPGDLADYATKVSADANSPEAEAKRREGELAKQKLATHSAALAGTVNESLGTHDRAVGQTNDANQQLKNRVSAGH